jgi:hypothetical protein
MGFYGDMVMSERQILLAAMSKYIREKSRGAVCSDLPNLLSGRNDTRLTRAEESEVHVILTRSNELRKCFELYLKIDGRKVL